MADGKHAPHVGVIGAGPAGLMAAEVMAQAGLRVTVFDASASAGRKFLLAGKGGLNLTHSEAIEQFLRRYHGGDADSQEAVSQWIKAFGPQDLREWCHGLGIETFIGTSGRVFPTSLKAAPLLRAWLHRLRMQGVRFAMRHRWVGWQENQPQLSHCGAIVALASAPKAWVLALGGGSWPQLGSDGLWVPLLEQSGVAVNKLQASNCGFDVLTPQANGQWRPGWSDHLRVKFSGCALKNIAATVLDDHWTQQGEILISDTGVEGNLVYAASSRLRQALLASDQPNPPQATLWLNLLPAFPPEKVIREATHPRGARSWSSHLKSRLGLDGAKMALLHELLPQTAWQDADAVAQAILALPITVTSPRPMAEAISTAGGVSFNAVTAQLELRARPGFFCAGEMLDWDAPTGGYLLTACMASGRVAGQGAIDRVKR